MPHTRQSLCQWGLRFRKALQLKVPHQSDLSPESEEKQKQAKKIYKTTPERRNKLNSENRELKEAKK